MSILSEYKASQGSSGSSSSKNTSTSQTTARKSILQEYVDKNGTSGLNENYVQKALANGGGNGATAIGATYNDDGTVSYPDYTSRLKALAEEKAKKEKASSSTIAYGSDGEVDAATTALNIWNDIKNSIGKSQYDIDIERLKSEKEELQKKLRSLARGSSEKTEIEEQIAEINEEISQARDDAYITPFEAYKNQKETEASDEYKEYYEKKVAEAGGTEGLNFIEKNRLKNKIYGDYLEETGVTVNGVHPYTKKNGDKDALFEGLESEKTEAAKSLSESGTATAAIEGSKSSQNYSDFVSKYQNMSYGEKLLNNIGSTAANYAASMLSAAMTAYDAITLGKVSSGAISEEDQAIYNFFNVAQNAASNLSSLAYSSMREKSNWLGKFVLDLEKTGTEQAIDRLFDLIAPGASLAAMGVRVFGQETQQAENEGKSLAQQVVSGLKSTVIEVGTEGMSGIGGSWRGTGYGDEILSSLDRWVSTKTGSELLGTLAAAFGGESAEEILSDILNPTANAILSIFGLHDGYDSAKDFWDDIWGDGEMLYDGLLGGVAGFFGGGTSYISNVQTAKAWATDIATYKAAQRIVENNDLREKTEAYAGTKLSDNEEVATAQVLQILENAAGGMRSAETAIRNGESLSTENVDNSTVQSSEAAEQAASVQTSEPVIEQTIEKLNLGKSAAELVREDYQRGDADAETFARGMEEAYNYGKLGASLESAINEGSFTKDLTTLQVEHAYRLGAMERENSTSETGTESASTSNVTTSNEAYMSASEYTTLNYGEDAETVTEIYNMAPETDVQDFASAFESAYDIGKSGMSESYALSVPETQTLTEAQRKAAYELGKSAASRTMVKKEAALTTKKQTGKKLTMRGKVKGEGVTMSELTETLNDPQHRAYRVMSYLADKLGVNIVLYKTEGKTETERETGKEYFTEPSGSYEPSTNTIRIAIDAGLYYTDSADKLSNYTMLRTFAHEFTHSIEQQAPAEYDELRRVVFDMLTERGENVDELIRLARTDGMSYEAASREVVAEAMTDILPDSKFINTLASEHQPLYKRLLQKLKQFVGQLRQAYRDMVKNPSRAANALKTDVGGTLHYMENIVAAWDKAAETAVANNIAVYGTEQAEKAPKAKAQKAKTQKAETASQAETVAAEPVKAKATERAEESAKESTAEEKSELPDDVTLQPQRTTETAEAEPESSAEITTASELTARLESYNRAEANGIVYEISEENGIFKGRIAHSDVNVGGVKIGNARGELYRTSAVSREALVKDMTAVAEKNRLLEPIEAKGSENIIQQEETTNGEESENGVNEGTVQQPERGGERAARLLDEVPPEAVHASSGGRRSVRDAGAPREADVQADGGADTAGADERNGSRDSVGGRVQRLSELSDEGAAEAAEAAKEEIHEATQRGIAQKSTAEPAGSNFSIDESLDLPSGTKARVRANIEAIKLVKQIAAEGRTATAEEQIALSKYVGWGGLPDAFGKAESNRETRKMEYKPVNGLEAEFEELKSILTEEEYAAARSSTSNAHYTSIEVIKAMYDGLKNLGFEGGRMLEPSSGVGNFVGAMPAEMTSKVKSWTMVELDNITGMIAKYLYPHADVRIQGFETANIPDGYMDVAIGNVPFGNYKISDKHYPNTVTSAIHNYFFAKSLDKVRTGGICMFITSSYTMSSSDSSVRKYIADRADLLGAIRLPNTAFQANAGTSVVTDILILKKRAPRTAYTGEAFLNSEYTWFRDNGETAYSYANEYFKNHPEMILGTPKIGRGMYRNNELTYEPFTDRGSLGEQIRKAMSNIKGRMDYPTQPTAEQANYRQASAKKKARKLLVKGGVLQSVDENGTSFKVTADADTTARIKGMIAIRDAHSALCDALQNGSSTRAVNKLRAELNKVYDSYVAKYGYLSAGKNRRAIGEFTDSYSLLSLENYSTETRKATKADIFTKNTIAPNRTVSSAENVEEGLTISLNQTGAVDTALIARLTGQKQESVTRQLIDQRLAFKDKDGNLIPAVQYLSGNVRAKLREMEGLVGIDSDYKNNVEALKAVVPPTVPYTEIYVNPGATWVPVSAYEQFVGHILRRNNYKKWNGKKDFEVTYVPETNEYKVTISDSYAKSSAENTQRWGESGKTFAVIFENMLNGRRTNVYYKGADGKSYLDKTKTQAVAEKAEKLGEEFRSWLWSDEARRADMEELYNEAYNSLVTPKYSGAGLTVNGLNSEYKLFEHQANAVSRIINSGGNTLLAHRVGAGKTLEMATAAMKLKQLGVIKKPMFVVPNNVVAQWGREFKTFYPAANILVVGDEDMSPAERMTTINKIKNNDYDAVILAYTKFEKIQMTKEWRRKFYQEQIDSVLFAINAEKEAQKGKGFTVKELEKKRKQLQAKLDKLSDKVKDDDGAMFEDLGVDSLFVDEAHNFKNLEYTTRMNNVSGLGNSNGSQRAFDLYTKVRYLQQLNGGRGIVFATATPVMNSMSEMYIMQRYLQPDTLAQLGIDNFDSWAKMFGEVVNELEVKPTGSGYRIKQSFSKFKNVKALQQLFGSFSDVVTEIPGLKIPKMKGGKVQIVQCEASDFQKEYMEELAKRADSVKGKDPSEDNMLKITSDGRKISYSQRMVDPSLSYEPDGKIMKCCENVYKVYKESAASKGTQMIFCDMATPKGKNKSSAAAESESEEFTAVDTESAQLYDDMKARLVELGIPAKEIAFIHDAKNDKQKAALADKMNEGTVRVLIGSTGKMGVGLNAQVKAVAIHHLDAPWRPGDIEQRDGRVFRQKNENKEAYKFVYVTKGSFDARLWDILERKQKFINQIISGDDVGNEVEDTGDVTLSAAEVKAIASGNPLIAEQVKLQKEISKLESLQQAHAASVSEARRKIQVDESHIAAAETDINNIKEDIKNRKDTYSSEKVFSMKVGSKTYNVKSEAGAALVAEAKKKAVEGEYTPVASFAGFTVSVIKDGSVIKGNISGAGVYPINIYVGNATYGINHIISTVEGLESKLERAETYLRETQNDLKAQKELAGAVFEQASELREKRARYGEIMDILNPPSEQMIDEDAESSTAEVQHQSRSYAKPESDEAEKYSYESLVSKPDMKITRVLEDNSLSRDEVVKRGRENAAAVGYIDGNGAAVVHVDDIDSDVVISRRGLEHGLDRRFNLLSPVTAKAGEIIKNSIRINELNPKLSAASDSYVLIGAADNEAEDLYVVQSIVNRFTNELDSIEVLYAVNAKKEPAGRMATPRSGQHKGSSPSGSVISISNLLDFVNEYFPDVLPKSVLRHYGHESRPAGEVGEYAKYQQRTRGYTDTEVLEIAAEQVDESKLNAAEKDALRIFKERVAKLQELQDARTEAGQNYRAKQFGIDADGNKVPVDRVAAQAEKRRMDILDSRIETAKNAVVKVEQAPTMRSILKEARSVVEQQEREQGQKVLQQYRERREESTARKKYRARVQKEVESLRQMLMRPGNKDALKHIPAVIQKTVADFIGTVDFTSARQLRGGAETQADVQFARKMTAMRDAIQSNINLNGAYSGYADLPPEFMETFQKQIDHVNDIIAEHSGEYVVNRMSASDLKELAGTLRDLRRYIQNMNRFHQNTMFAHAYEAGEDTVQHLAKLGTAKGKKGGAYNFMAWQYMRPVYGFKRFGKGGESIYNEFRQGQAQQAFIAQKIIDFAEKTYTAKEVKEWSNDIKTFNIGGEKVSMPATAAMSFYCLSKRPQALTHIYGDGIRVATFESGKYTYRDEGHALTQEEAAAISASLTDRQKAVADELQRFMSKECAEWGNYVSMRRFGTEIFGEEYYFPINSDGRHLPAEAEETPDNASLYALLNISFSKELKENAKNRLVLYNIFDVFANHTASMAQYRSFALPVLDALKWFNYRSGDTGVRDKMAAAYGTPTEGKPGSGSKGYAEQFVLNILRAFNGTTARGDAHDGFAIRSLHRFNRAQVAFNTRTIIQQPLAVTRAAMVIPVKNLAKGLAKSAVQMKALAAEMEAHSGIAAWKSLGFYDTNISRGLTQLIKRDYTFGEKVTEKGMFGAETADRFTWAAMWSACKDTVKRSAYASESEYFDAVTELFEKVIYETQVVDSVLTKAEFLRAQGGLTRVAGAFMSEPSATMSMLVDAYTKYTDDMQRGMSRSEAWQRNAKNIGKTFMVYAVGQTMLALAQSIADAWRDDDEYQTFIEKYVEALEGNVIDELLPFGKIPYISEFYDMAKDALSKFGVDTYGNSISNGWAQYAQYLSKGIEILADKVTGNDTKYTWWGAIYNLLRGGAGASGFPVATLAREVVDLWNNTAGAFNPSWILQTYEAGDKNDIKYAEQDGYLTTEEATQALIEKGVYEDEEEAKQQAEKWAAQSEAEKETGYTSDNWEKAFSDSKASDEEKDKLVEAYAGEYFKPPYEAIRSVGYSASEAYNMIDIMDINDNSSVTQEEVYRYLSTVYGYDEAKTLWDAIAQAKGWQSKGVIRSYEYAVNKFS